MDFYRDMPRQLERRRRSRRSEDSDHAFGMVLIVFTLALALVGLVWPHPW